MSSFDLLRVASHVQSHLLSRPPHLCHSLSYAPFQSYLIFVTCTTCGAGVKNFSLVSKNCELVCFGVNIARIAKLPYLKSEL